MIPPRSEGFQYATGKSGGWLQIAQEKNEVSGPKQKQCSVVAVSNSKSKINAIKNITA